MTTLQLALFDSPSGALLSDVSGRAGDVVLSTNEHGVEALRARVDTLLVDAFRFFDQPGLLHVALSDGAMDIGTARLEDPSVTSAGHSQGISALGYWRALYDLESAYTALWSTTGVVDWRPATPDVVALAQPDRFQMDNNNRIYIAPQKNASYANAGANNVLGPMYYDLPDGVSRNPNAGGVQFDYEMILPANWLAQLNIYNSAGALIGGVWSLAATGALQNGSIHVNALAGNPVRFVFSLYYNAAAAVYAGETGASYLKITNWRLVTGNANRVNTTWSAPAGPVTGVQTVTPASMAGIYAGQRLFIRQGAVANAESVIVTATTATTFTATFVKTQAAGVTIQAHQVYADEIAKDTLSAIAVLNPNQIGASTALIQSPGLDISDAIYEDATAADVLIGLAARGDASNQLYEVGVTDQRLLYFRPRGSVARAWVVDATNLEVERSLEALINSIYATYQDANGRTLRTSTTSDTASIGRYGITRRASVAVTTISSKLATTEQTTYLLDHADPLPRAKISFDAIYDAGGGRWPLHLVRAGDTISIRNLPPTLSTSIDRIRTFRITHTEYRADSDTLEIEVEASLPTTVTTIVQAAQKKVRGG